MKSSDTRWHVPIGGALLLAGAGIWLVEPVLLVAAMVPLVFVAYSALSTAPSVTKHLEIQRDVTPTRTYPGAAVDVTLKIEYTGEGRLLDLRIVDGVPAELAVVDGSPRAILSLESGEHALIEYTLRARHGEFDFEPATVSTYSLSAGSVATSTVEGAGDRRIAATLDPGEFPLAEQTTGIVGELPTDSGGEGLEFHGIRSYQPEDPVNRINWHQYARERKLSTIDYRQEEAVEVMVIVDARSSARVASAESAPTGLELSVYLATEILNGLHTTRNRAGAAILGIDGTTVDGTTTGTDQLAWVAPGSDREVRTQIQALFNAATATVSPERRDDDGDSESDVDAVLGTEGVTDVERTDVEPADEGADGSAPNNESDNNADVREIAQRIQPRTQVVLVTPLCDDYPVTLTRQLRTAGHAVNVYSPDVTVRETPGGMVETAQRSLNLTELRRLGVTVVDWQPDEPLGVAFDRGTEQTNATTTQL